LVSTGSYVEVSPSGTGLRGFVYGMTLDDCKEKAGNLEVYGKDSVRYVSATGVPFGEYRPVIENQAAIEAFMVRFGFVKPKPMPPPPWKPAGPSACSHMRTAPAAAANGDPESWPAKSDDEILKLLRQNNKRGAITRLLEGNTVDYGGGVSESRAGLIGHLAYYSNDVKQIARIVEASGLQETKKGQERGGKPFEVWEVERVLDGLSGRASYWVDRAEKAAGSAVAKARTKTLKEKGAAHLDGDIAPLLNGRGVLRNTSAVMAEILKRDRRLAGAVFFDLFALMPFKTELFADIFGVGAVGVTPLKDSDLRAVEAWLFREYGIEAKKDDVKRAVFAWADSVAVNPITDRLDELAAAWDGKPRLVSWFVDYLGAVVEGGDEELALYYSVIGTRFLISCVARAYQPGCKVDTLLIIEGVQGARKSSGMRELTGAVSARAFLEGFSIARLDRDTRQQLRGRLMAEIGELDGMNRHETEGLKNFVSTTTDTYRDPYGTFNEDFPRTVVLVGTTNESSYLRDPTGNRRYWPAKIGKVKLEALRLVAGQLWGEAVQMYRQGAQWWIDEEGAEDADVRRIQQRECLARMVPDSWADLVSEFMEKLATGKAAGILPRKSIDTDIDGSWKLSDLMMLALGDEGGGRRSVPEEVRFRAALKRCGWQHNGSEKHGRWKLSAAAKTELLSWVR
jgi:predicted P-loop ATPase